MMTDSLHTMETNNEITERIRVDYMKKNKS